MKLKNGEKKIKRKDLKYETKKHVYDILVNVLMLVKLI